MKRVPPPMVLLSSVVFWVGILGLNACTDETPLQSKSFKTHVSLEKRGARPGNETSLPEEGSATARYYRKWDAYQGAKIILSQGSQFEFYYDALRPPAEMYGSDVTVTMRVVPSAASNELLFEFGPAGCQFVPAATVWFHYTGSNPRLYYIDADGAYIEQQPNEVDLQNQWLILRIKHFSRYAVAWSN